MSIIFSDSCKEVIKGAASGMLSGKFLEIAKPFIQYDCKRMARIGARCEFGYSNRICRIMSKFDQSHDYLEIEVKNFVDEVEKSDIKDFVIKKCAKLLELHKNCFLPQLTETDFFKETLGNVNRLGRAQKRSESGEISDASDEEISDALTQELRKEMRGCILDSLQLTMDAIKGTQIKELQKYCQESEEKIAAAKSGHHLDLVLNTVTIGINTPDTAIAAVAAQKPAAKKWQKSKSF